LQCGFHIEIPPRASIERGAHARIRCFVTREPIAFGRAASKKFFERIDELLKKGRYQWGEGSDDVQREMQIIAVNAELDKERELCRPRILIYRRLSPESAATAT
jgi:hypothetical protein